MNPGASLDQHRVQARVAEGLQQPGQVDFAMGFAVGFAVDFALGHAPDFGACPLQSLLASPGRPLPGGDDDPRVTVAVGR